MADTDNIYGDLWTVTIDGNDAPFHARVSVGEMLDVHNATSGRTGSDIIKRIVMGRKPVLTFVFIEATLAALQQALGTGAGTASPALGDELPTHTVQLHNPTHADATRDLYFTAMSFGNIQKENDGQGTEDFTVVGTGQPDGDGHVWHLGGAPAE